MVAFWQGVNYIIDCYGFYSNSAIAVNTFIRSIFGAAFVSLLTSTHLTASSYTDHHSLFLPTICTNAWALRGPHLYLALSA